MKNGLEKLHEKSKIRIFFQTMKFFNKPFLASFMKSFMKKAKAVFCTMKWYDKHFFINKNTKIRKPRVNWQ